MKHPQIALRPLRRLYLVLERGMKEGHEAGKDLTIMLVSKLTNGASYSSESAPGQFEFNSRCMLFSREKVQFVYSIGMA